MIPLCQSEVALDSRLSLPIDTVLDGGYRITRVVGSGGFGITYAAEDINLGTTVALKEYYPFDFGDRDTTMSVRPKSERHKKTFDWGRSNFLQEARTLARFEHTSIVRVTRVFETNSTAYMVMRFEEGESFEIWLRDLGRPPTQDELDRITAPLLDALQMMHAENFLHRDIAPDNIIVRGDGTPVLLDFGAARRAVAEMSRALTGVVKAGYSPHEQYSSDGRQQGPWSDIYALGATLYRAVAGYPPEEVTLRVDQDHMRPATQAANGRYRPEFLSAIDACLKVRHSERPRSVAQLRPMLLDAAPPVKREPEPAKARQPMSGPTSTRKVSTLRPPPAARPRRWPAVAAALLALLGGAYGGIEYMRWQPAGSGASTAEAKRQAADTEASRLAAADAARRQEEATAAAQRQAALDAEKRRQKEAVAASQRQADSMPSGGGKMRLRRLQRHNARPSWRPSSDARTRRSALPLPRAGTPRNAPGSQPPRSVRMSAQRLCDRYKRCSRRAAATTALLMAAATTARRRPWTISSPVRARRSRRSRCALSLPKPQPAISKPGCVPLASSRAICALPSQSLRKRWRKRRVSTTKRTTRNHGDRLQPNPRPSHREVANDPDAAARAADGCGTIRRAQMEPVADARRHPVGASATSFAASEPPPAPR